MEAYSPINRNAANTPAALRSKLLEMSCDEISIGLVDRGVGVTGLGVLVGDDVIVGVDVAWGVRV